MGQGRLHLLQLSSQCSQCLTGEQLSPIWGYWSTSTSSWSCCLPLQQKMAIITIFLCLPNGKHSHLAWLNLFPKLCKMLLVHGPIANSMELLLPLFWATTTSCMAAQKIKFTCVIGSMIIISHKPLVTWCLIVVVPAMFKILSSYWWNIAKCTAQFGSTRCWPCNMRLAKKRRRA